MKIKKFNLAGFTLVELLIVVAIIGILAAIAIPNFLSAQTRTKVSRVQADFRNLAAAFEMYKVDNQYYPPASNLSDPNHRQRVQIIDRFRRLTSPVEYMTFVPEDPFFTKSLDPIIPAIYGGRVYNYFERDWSVLSTLPWGPEAEAQNALWFLNSFGPNRSLESVIRDGFYNLLTYDPTNGTISNGQIKRFGP